MPQTALHRLIPLLLVVLLAAQEIFASYRRRAEAEQRDKGSLYVVWLLTAAGYIAAFRLWGGGRPPGPPLGAWSLWVGAVVALAGLGLRTWSVVTLGRYFTYVVKVAGDQPVIETGPYRLLRHPSYAGGLLTALGIGLTLGYALAPPIAAVPHLLGLLIRMRVEEQALLATIGEPYRAYMRRTKRIVPFIY
jgi:protein-S-isoprenylcysteine O-methyltransferase Ste14